MTGRYWRRSTPSVHEQLAAMRFRWPQFECSIAGGRLTCVGIIQPRPVSGTYTIQIGYTVGWYPRTSVLKPALRRRRPDQRIPHTYSDSELCLFTPSDGDWTSDMLIATTIVPWTYEWIVFYEVWLGTGEWLGGGSIPGESERGGEPLEDAG